MILLESRRRGLDFEEAWHSAMRVLRVERDQTEDHLRAELKAWKKALTWAREHFEASYESHAANGARPSRSDALSRELSAGKHADVHVHAEHAFQR